MNKKHLRGSSKFRLLTQAVMIIASQIVANAGPTKGAGNTSFPQISLPEPVRSEKAVQALGANLPEVARAYGLTAAELQSLFADDHTLAVDRQGRLHYVEPVAEAIEAAAEVVVAEAVAPLADTFKLHSKPGAKRTIYLDFDGHYIVGTGWNSSYNNGNPIDAPPWDIDSNPGNFSDTERTRIQQVWQRVAEDFAPFDVDVTTELTSESLLTRSSVADEYYGTRVLVSPISSYVGQAGGVAYIGAFDDVGDTYKPALVFPEMLGHSEKNIAEAATHEAGHNLGLYHDGTPSTGYYSGHGSGDVGWAPIMGVGYYKNLSQWSRGEYAGANQKQDDLAVIQSYGLAYRVDDHGNTAAEASYFPAGATISTRGLIERSTDADVFAFTAGAGTVIININPMELGPNLDILAEIRDANGTLIEANNPYVQLSAAFNLNLPSAGTYFLTVRGTGYGDPLTTGYSAYGSIGQYVINGNVTPPPTGIAPVANVTATPISGTAPLVVQLDGSSSFDQDGTIASYDWSFGDGTTGSGVTAQHTYQAAGTYTATLTVTDNSGMTAAATVLVTVQGAPLQTIRVQSVTIAPVLQRSGDYARVVVTVTDVNGAPVSGATVRGTFSGVLSSTVTATTGADGTATATSGRTKKNGTITYTVTGLSKSGTTYDATGNLQSTATTSL